MPINLKNSSDYIGFRGKILGMVSCGILFLAVSITILSGWITDRGYEERTIEQGLKTVEYLAENSTLPLLYESKEDALIPLEKVLGFNNTVEAVIYTKDGVLFQGVGEDKEPDNSISRTICGAEVPRLLKRGESIWQFCTPVLVGGGHVENGNDPGLYHEPHPQEELIGFVRVSVDISPLHKLQYGMFLSNMVIALSVATVLLIFVNIGINRVVQPLYSLSQTIRDARKVSSIEGPKEIVDIALVYNEMMEGIEQHEKKLEDHRKMLEAEVIMRTKELVQARDLALVASDSKTRFVANTSHELRTPLQSIIGYTELARDELHIEGREDLVEHLDIVCTDAEKLLTLINTILDLSKVESGEIALKLVSLDIHSILKEAAVSVRPLMDYHQNTLEVVDETVGHGRFSLDRMKTLQILTNLLSNAGKFTKDGKVTLTAKIQEHRLVFLVADTGIGILAEDQKFIFEAFKQVEGLESRHLRGTGLGLAITKQFCTLMGGDISVVSTFGKGSTFKVELPLKRI